MDLCVALVGVDTEVADDEMRVLDEAALAWNLPVPLLLAEQETAVA